MKKYFDFTVTGKQLLPIWLILFLLIIIPYLINNYYTQHITPVRLQGYLVLIQLLIIFIGCLVAFPMFKILLNGIRFKDQNVACDVCFSNYFNTVLPGIFFSVFTFGIYLPWFYRNLTTLFCESSTLDSEEFKFEGSAGRLLLIMFVLFFIPIVLVSIFVVFIKGTPDKISMLPIRIGMIFMLIPYIYFVYKWFVDVTFKKYHIQWETDFFPSIFKLFVEILMSVVTVGIYLPMAWLRLYDYFSEQTFARSEEATLQFGFDYDAQKDFLYIWGQMLLTIVTLGIYYPWAIANVGKRFLSQTYLVNVEEVNVERA